MQISLFPQFVLPWHFHHKKTAFDLRLNVNYRRPKPFWHTHLYGICWVSWGYFVAHKRRVLSANFMGFAKVDIEAQVTNVPSCHARGFRRRTLLVLSVLRSTQCPLLAPHHTTTSTRAFNTDRTTNDIQAV